MENKSLFKKNSMTKHKKKQNYQYKNKTQCPKIFQRKLIHKVFLKKSS